MSWLSSYFEYVQHIPLALVSIAIWFVILVIYIRRRTEIQSSRMFIVLIVLVILRVATVIFTYANDSVDNLILWTNIQFPFNATLVIAWFVFVLRYTGTVQRINPRHVLTLFIIPLSVTFVMWFMPDSQLFRISYEMGIYQGLPRLYTEYGPLYAISTIYIYGVAITATGMMFRYLYSSPGVHRRQAFAVLVAATIIIVVYLIQNQSDVHPAYVPQLIIFIAQGVVIASMLRDGFLRLRPGERPLLMLVMNDAFVLFDHYQRVTDLNDGAVTIIGQPKSEIIGKPIVDMLATMPDVLPLLDDDNDGTSIELTVKIDDDVCHFQVSVFRIQEQGALSRCMVWHDVTAQKQAEEERIENLANQARIQALTNFVQTASHDLKHPLTNIGVRLYLLEKTLSEQKQIDHVETIRAQADKLQGILDDMFLLMRLESNQDIYLMRMSLSELLTAIYSRYQPIFAEQNITFELKKPDDPYTIIGDYSLLMNALSQLLDNARHYTPDGGSVTIELVEHSPYADVVITDTGEGIPADKLDRIVEPFYRVDGARNSNSGGAGLGLTLVQRIMSHHSGTLNVQSEVNKGTQITLTLPLAIDGSDEKVLAESAMSH